MEKPCLRQSTVQSILSRGQSRYLTNIVREGLNPRSFETRPNLVLDTRPSWIDEKDCEVPRFFPLTISRNEKCQLGLDNGHFKSHSSADAVIKEYNKHLSVCGVQLHASSFEV
ncbi:hypothetical protein AVEN_136842-1 [Araneus ventricosus]|uniref:Uncharacterized protein n=1 Tax=Araneus ventricosus TaxID=182803 RepID=A0A4Y2G1U3_ARAVE|nr:hypothetical protein AVEN_136842-1 [Araneus ventricosus]